MLITLLLAGCIGGGYQPLPENQQFVSQDFPCPDNIIKYGDPRWPQYYTCKFSR